MVRVRDPWWRRALVAFGLLAPRWREETISDVLYGDGRVDPLPGLRALEEDVR